MRALARGGGRIDFARIEETLAGLDVFVGEEAQPGRVAVASPEKVRARRFAAVFVCGLQEGEFPAGSASDPFLSDADRREIAKASGLVAAAARGPARARALPLLRLRVARRAAGSS